MSRTLLLVLIRAGLLQALSQVSPIRPSVIKNGGFEADPPSFAPWTVTSSQPNFAAIVPQGHHSNHSFQFSGSASTNLQQNFAQTSGQVYQLSYDFRAVYPTGVNDSAQVTAGIVNSQSEAVYSLGKQYTKKWQTIIQTFGSEPNITTPGTVYFVLSPSKEHDPVMQIDNVKLQPVGPANDTLGTSLKYQTTGANAVANPGFETGSLAPWTYGGSTLILANVTQPGLRGSGHKFFANATSADTGIFQFTIFDLHQSIAITKTQKPYLIAFDVLIESANLSDIQCKVNAASNPSVIWVFLGTGNLQRFQRIFTPFETPFDIDIQCLFYAPGQVSLDNFELKQIK